MIVELEAQARKISRPVMIQPLFTQAPGLEVAHVVENGEGVTVLEHARPIVGGARRSQHMVRVTVGRTCGARRWSVHFQELAAHAAGATGPSSPLRKGIDSAGAHSAFPPFRRERGACPATSRRYTSS